MTYEEIISLMKEQDPDYVVDVLGITSAELLDAFPLRARGFILEEYEVEGINDEQDEEGDTD